MKKKYIVPQVEIVELENPLPVCGSLTGDQADILVGEGDAPDAAESGGYRSSLWN